MRYTVWIGMRCRAAVAMRVAVLPPRAPVLAVPLHPFAARWSRAAGLGAAVAARPSPAVPARRHTFSHQDAARNRRQAAVAAAAAGGWKSPHRPLRNPLSTKAADPATAVDEEQPAAENTATETTRSDSEAGADATEATLSEADDVVHCPGKLRTQVFLDPGNFGPGPGSEKVAGWPPQP